MIPGLLRKRSRQSAQRRKQSGLREDRFLVCGSSSFSTPMGSVQRLQRAGLVSMLEQEQSQKLLLSKRLCEAPLAKFGASFFLLFFFPFHWQAQIRFCMELCEEFEGLRGPLALSGLFLRPSFATFIC